MKKCVECSKVTQFIEVCRSDRNRTIYDLEQESDQHHEGEEEDHIDVVNMNSIIFNSKQSVITANLKSVNKLSFNNSTM